MDLVCSAGPCLNFVGPPPHSVNVVGNLPQLEDRVLSHLHPGRQPAVQQSQGGHRLTDLLLPPSTRSPGYREWGLHGKKKRLKLQIERYFLLELVPRGKLGLLAKLQVLTLAASLFSVKSRLPIMSFILFRPEQSRDTELQYTLGGISNLL